MTLEVINNILVAIFKPILFILSQDIAVVKTTFHYFLSTVAQSAAALFALASIFAIFRIQEINKQLSRSYDSYREWVIMRFSVNIESQNRIRSMGIDYEPKSWLDKDVMDHLVDFIQKEKAQTEKVWLRALTDYYLHISSHREFAKLLKSKLLISTILLSVIFLDAIFTLPFIPYFVANNNKLITYDVLLLLSLTLIEIIYLFHYVRFALAGPKEKYINNPIVNRLP